MFFPKILEYSELWPFSVLTWCQCVYTHQAGRKLALQQNWQSSEKSQQFKEKTQYLINTLYKNGVLVNILYSVALWRSRTEKNFAKNPNFML